NHLWEWYFSELLQRTHNDSRKVLIMTRWNTLDIAGELERLEASQWKIIRIPALCEDEESEYELCREAKIKADGFIGNDRDELITEPPRRKGEALWPEKFSREM